MNIEVIVNGKGAITISQKVDVPPKTLQKLTAHAVELLTSTPGKGVYGFGAGAEMNAEVLDG